MESIEQQIPIGKENAVAPDVVCNDLIKFYQQMTEHSVKYSNIFSALFTLQNKVISLEKKFESSIGIDKKNKELEEIKNIKSEMETEKSMKKLEEFQNNFEKNTVINGKYKKQIEIKNMIKHKNEEVKYLQEETDKKKEDSFKYIDDKPDKSNNWLGSDQQLYKQAFEFSNTMVCKECGKKYVENQEAILVLKQDLENCKTSILQQREILRALECKYFTNKSNEKLKTKMLLIEKENDCKFDDIHQTIQELKTDWKNGEETLNIKMNEIQELINGKIIEIENVILSKIHEANQKMENNKSFEPGLDMKFHDLDQWNMPKTMDEELKKYILDVKNESDRKFDKIYQTVQQLKIDTKNVDETLGVKIDEIQLLNITEKKQESTVMFKVHESSQKMTNIFHSFKSNLFATVIKWKYQLKNLLENINKITKKVIAA